MSKTLAVLVVFILGFTLNSCENKSAAARSEGGTWKTENPAETADKPTKLTPKELASLAAKADEAFRLFEIVHNNIVTIRLYVGHDDYLKEWLVNASLVYDYRFKAALLAKNINDKYNVFRYNRESADTFKGKNIELQLGVNEVVYEIKNGRLLEGKYGESDTDRQERTAKFRTNWDALITAMPAADEAWDKLVAIIDTDVAPKKK
jgi:hypothetical protein